MKAKKGLRIFLIITIVILSLFAIGNSGWSIQSNSNEVPERDTSYYIEDYDINIVVNDDNTIDVKEVITAIFVEPYKHGIYRNIPLTHTMDIVENGKTKTITQTIKDYNVSGNQYAVKSYQEGNLVIRMGSEGYYQEVGKRTIFALNYTLDLGKDYAETYDMLYYNILGTGWQVPIKNLDYSISMPKDYDKNQINMYRGRYGSRNAINTYLTIDNIISGNEKDFVVGVGLTLDVRLPENYFTNAKTITFAVAEICIYIAIAVLVAIITFFVLRKPKCPIVQPIEFYPPNNMNPVQVATVLNGKASINDIVSLIVYFASKKYITIKYGEKKSMILHKVKQINPKEKSYVKKFFNRLFAEGDTVDLSNDMDKEVNIDYVDTKGKNKTMTYDGLSTEIYECANLANEYKPVKTRFEKRNLVFSIVGVALAGIAAMVYCIGYSAAIQCAEIIQIVSFGLVIASIYLIMLELGIHKDCYTNKGLIIYWVLILWYIVYYVMMTILSFESISYTQGYTQYIVLPIVLVATIASAYIVTYSKKQSELLGKVLGFKNFILTCEKDRMDVLLKDNPEYFYDILPYAYVMGISDEFMDRFEILGYKPPVNEFYGGVFDRVYFYHYCRRVDVISKGAIRAQTSARIGSGSIGGGGGFSGGGFGGGGGGSW